MFPTFDVPPQHAETVGARKARRAKADDATRRSSSATSQSSGSTRSVKHDDAASSSDSRTVERSGFGSWFGKSSKKGVKEISPLSTVKNPPPPQELLIELEPEADLENARPAPRTAPLELRPSVHSRPASHRSDQEPHALQPQCYPPPLRSLPSPPPSGARSTVSGSLLSPVNISQDRRSQYSSISGTSSSNFGSTAHSTTSFVSSVSSYEPPDSEEIYDSQLCFSRPTEHGRRTGGTQSNNYDHGTPAAQSPFARALVKMENASARIISTRLSEEWEGLDDDESYQEVMFEKRLWALTAYHRLTQNKALQSPAHELLSNSRPADQARILQVNGSIADGWTLATRYPTTSIYTLSSTNSSKLPTAYPAPLNHHSLNIQSMSSPIPFPDNYFDAIVSRSIATVFRNDEWARSFFEFMRVLKPGGHIEILSVDAHMSCEGPKLSSWVDEHLSCRLVEQGISKQASDTILDTVELAGLDHVRRARVALPAQPPKVVAKAVVPPSHTHGAAVPPPTPQDALDSNRMMASLGRHFYQDLYAKFMQVDSGEEWFWLRKDIRDECERYKTKMVLSITCAQKPYLG